MNNLAFAWDRQGRYDEAEQLYVKVLEVSRRVLGEEHPDTVGSMYNLACLYKDQGRYEQAEPLYVELLDIRRRVLGEEHPDTLNTLIKLYEAWGKPEKAEEWRAKLAGKKSEDE